MDVRIRNGGSIHEPFYRDKKDNFLLEVALEGEADYLITGDEDILVLGSFYNIKIIRPKDFEAMLK